MLLCGDDRGGQSRSVPIRIEGRRLRRSQSLDRPPRSKRTATIRWNKRLYRRRNRIERMIGHLKINRAIAARRGKLARSFLDMLHLAALRRGLRHAT